MNFEVYFMNSFGTISGSDMTFMLPIVCSCFFLMTASIKLDVSHKRCAILYRKLSTLIYGFHLFIQFYFAGIIKFLFGVVFNDLILYIITSILTLCISYVIIEFSKKERFKLLKKVYS